MRHKDEHKPDNLLTRGQEIAVQVDEAKTVAMPLSPGEISLHNVRLAHASGPNRSTDRRIGLSLHYMPTFIIPSHDLVVVRLGHYKGASPGNSGLKNALALLMEAVPESR